MSDSAGLSRQALYANWLAWATANLGSDPQQAAAAANAAADVAVHGDGFEAAQNAATAAWYKTAQVDGTLWRPSFWSLLITNPFAWILPVALVVLVISTASSAASNAWGAALIAVPIGVVVLVWQVGYALLLSSQGVAAPASLLKVERVVIYGRGGGRSYVATYEFEFQGQQRSTTHSYRVEDSVRQSVVVLFYPKLPWIAKVLPELVRRAPDGVG